ncbi:hypothetical protein BJ912DRAFT_929188 [Pholiota molesta]|nr:hypothetical protein BJ912DRAFT_929188 [Pholiota molesta]
MAPINISADTNLVAKLVEHRQELMEMDNYAASPNFAQLWRWKKRDSKLGNILNVEGSDNPVYASVVGVVSADRLFVQAHGNYTRNAEFVMKMNSTKMQFTLKRPDNSPFAADFDAAIRHLEAAQNAIKIGSSPPRHLVITEADGAKSLRMSYPIFEEKTAESDTATRKMKNQLYPISNDFKDDFNALLEEGKFQLRLETLPVWSNTKLLKISDFHRSLSGALVEVDFCVKHYFMKKQGEQDLNRGTNTFSSDMQQVNILRFAPPPIPSPYAGRAVAGPLRISQSSPKKSKAAQKAPVRDIEEVTAITPLPNEGPSNLGNGKEVNEGDEELVHPGTPETEQELSNEGPSSLGKRKNVVEELEPLTEEEEDEQAVEQEALATEEDVPEEGIEQEGSGSKKPRTKRTRRS